MSDLAVHGEIWEMKEGKTTAINVDGEIYRLVTPKPPSTPYIRNQKEPYLYKWIRKENIKEFTLKKFYDAYPKMREREKNVIGQIAKLLDEDKIMQMGKDRFVVKKNLE